MCDEWGGSAASAPFGAHSGFIRGELFERTENKLKPNNVDREGAPKPPPLCRLRQVSGGATSADASWREQGTPKQRCPRQLGTVGNY
jgi:hypothetical protein